MVSHLKWAALVTTAGCSLFGYDPRPSEWPRSEPDAGEDAFDASFPDAGYMDASFVEAGELDATLDARDLDVGLSDAVVDEAPVDAALDATLADASMDAGPGCAGTTALNLCWYLAPANTSCNSFCASHGGYDTRTASVVGTNAQGGSLANCQTVFSALGVSGTVSNGTRTDLKGLGCHQWVATSVLWWLGALAFDPSATNAQSRPTCACLQ